MGDSRWMMLVLPMSLVGCGALTTTDGGDDRGFDAKTVRTPAACTVNVHIDEFGDMLVDAEPVRTRRCNANRKVTLLLEQSSPFTFDVEPKGVTFPTAKNPSPPTSPPDCKRKDSGKKYECKFEGKSGYKWAYKIQLLKSGVVDAILDPTMIND